MKKLMIIGAGREQQSIIQKCRARGLHVVSTDANPDAPGARYANEFFVASTDDAEKNLKIAQKCQIDGVLTVSSELAVPVVARIADEMRLPGVNTRTAELFTAKVEMKKVFLSTGIPTAEFLVNPSLPDALMWFEKHHRDIVVKPSINSGQRGVTRVNQVERLDVAINDAIRSDPSGSFLIEEFIDGVELNVVAVVSDGTSQVLSITERITSSERFGIATAHAYPPEINSLVRESVELIVNEIATNLGVQNGILYPQFLITTCAELYVIEVACRIPGGLMSTVSNYVSGLDLEEIAINLALDEKLPSKGLTAKRSSKKLLVRFLTSQDFDSDTAVTLSHTFIDEISRNSCVLDFQWYLSPEQKIPDLKYSGDRFGALILEGDSREELSKTASRLIACLQGKDIRAIAGDL